jgi:hypothetical protein
MGVSNSRTKRIVELNRVIGHRLLIWFGIRGEDAVPLLALDAFGASFSVTARTGSATLDRSCDLTLEELSGLRVDLDRYDLDLDSSPAANAFRSGLLRASSTHCVLVTYRPSAFTSALAFSMQDTLILAGMYKDRQRAFEHKPWVETQLAGRGVRSLGWTYVADSRRAIAARALNHGPLVLRTSRDSGGVGISLVRTADELVQHWPNQEDQFVAIAPYLDCSVPVNLSGCVFPDGSISCHPPSVQLIGAESMTVQRFGYCGNDFSLIKDLSASALDALHGLLLAVGNWLYHERYLGAFGVDALVRGDEVFFTEVNARMQGSTSMSAQVAQQLDLPDLVLDHVAANLGLGSGYRSPTVREWVSAQPDLAHLILHNVSNTDVVNVSGNPNIIGNERWALDPGDVRINPGGVLGRLIWPGRVTEDGFSIDSDARAIVDSRRACFADATEEGRI